jgi:hypothetical protein
MIKEITQCLFYPEEFSALLAVKKRSDNSGKAPDTGIEIIGFN